MKNRANARSLSHLQRGDIDYSQDQLGFVPSEPNFNLNRWKNWCLREGTFNESKVIFKGKDNVPSGIELFRNGQALTGGEVSVRYGFFVG